ncbi:conserved hypothetical protein, partial [Ricinus communis]
MTPQREAMHMIAPPPVTSRNDLADAALDAINRAQAVIEFGLDGRILHANQNFLDALGYELHEVVGQPHAMFCEP